MNTWFRYFLTKAISQRRGRFILSSAAVMLSVAVVTALATISLGVRDKIGAELKHFAKTFQCSNYVKDRRRQTGSRPVRPHAQANLA